MVGTVAASDPDAGNTLSYAIVGGNAGGAFSIDAATGQLLVANAATLDFETNPSIALRVQVTDSGTPGLTDTATVTVQLNDMTESVAPPTPHQRYHLLLRPDRSLRRGAREPPL